MLKKKANRENEIDGAKCDGRDKDKKIKDRWIHERRNGILHFSNFLFSFCRVFHHFYCLFFYCFFFQIDFFFPLVIYLVVVVVVEDCIGFRDEVK